MPRRVDAPSRMEILLLTALSRCPMHGYDLKLELRYKHVKWWAKADHGHLYMALARLARGGFVRETGGSGRRRVYAITPAGRRRLLAALDELGRAPDSTYFDVDVFLSACHLLDRGRALVLLAARREALVAGLAEAEELVRTMSPFVPAAGRLIMAHRIAHLRREIDFAAEAAEALRAEATWGSFLGQQPVTEFVKSRKVPLESK